MDTNCTGEILLVHASLFISYVFNVEYHIGLLFNLFMDSVGTVQNIDSCSKLAEVSLSPISSHIVDISVVLCRALIVSGIIVLLMSEKIAPMLPRSLRRVLKPKPAQPKGFSRSQTSSITRRDVGSNSAVHVKVSS